LEEAGVQVAEPDRCAADVLAPDGEPRFVWSELPPGEGSYNQAVFAQILQRHAWRAQYDKAKRVTGRTGRPVDNRAATPRWLPSGPVNAWHCWNPPTSSWPRSPPPWSPGD